MQRNSLSLLSLSLSSVMLAACGSSGPDTAKVRADFENPSGKTSDKDAVIAANSKRTASGGATSAAGALSPFGGLGLTSRNASEGPFSRVSVFTVHDFIQRSLRRPGPVSARFHAQTDEDYDFSGCFDPSSVSGSGSSDGRSASYSYSINFGDCNSGMTGTMSVDGDFEFSEDFQSGEGVFEMEYSNVCTTATGQCINGVIAMEFKNDGAEGQSYLIAWDLTMSGGEAGTIQTKGGMKYSTDGGATNFEYLAYVRDSSGAEVSYVFKINQDSGGTTTLSIRGADGSIDCTFNSDGSGSCEGDASFTWEEGYADQIANDPAFADYGD